LEQFQGGTEMIKTVITILNLVVILLVGFNCSSTLQKSTTVPNQPKKIIFLTDGLLFSEPYPITIEVKDSKKFLDGLLLELKQHITALNNIEPVNYYSTIGLGTMRKIANRSIDTNNHADSLIYPLISEDVKELNGASDNIVKTLCEIVNMKLNRETSDWIIQDHFKMKSNLNKLQKLQSLTNADYCMVTSFDGTKKRKSISPGEQFGAAAVALAASLIMGCFMIVPGDETEFNSYSILINLKSGKVEWSKGYSIYKLNAVEKFDPHGWVNEVFKKIKIGGVVYKKTKV
jgi:hypothetical protein